MIQKLKGCRICMRSLCALLLLTGWSATATAQAEQRERGAGAAEEGPAPGTEPPSTSKVKPGTPGDQRTVAKMGGPISASAPNPHASGASAIGLSGPPKDRSEPSSAVPANTIEVQLIGVGGAKPERARVQLITSFQSIAEGNSDTITEKAVGLDAKVRFENLKDALRFNYAVRVEYQGAHYQIPAFRLGRFGQSVVLHIYPSTQDINESFVGMRGFQYVQLREGFFRIDVMYRVMNMSLSTWLPRNVVLSLPPGAEAIEARTPAGDAGFVSRGTAVELVGTFPPGQRDVQFSFQVPNRNQRQVSLTMSLPPHLAELRVLAEQTSDMVLDVPGFEAPQSTEGPDGKQVLITGRTMEPGQTEMKSVTIELSGLPTVGPGRWFAVALASLLGGGGLAAATRRRKRDRQGEQEQLERARRILLEEMHIVELAHREEAIGPRTYEQTKREILLSLARLEKVEATVHSSSLSN